MSDPTPMPDPDLQADAGSDVPSETNAGTPPTALETALEVAQFLDSKRAEDVVIMNVRDVLFITSYFVLATGTSSRAIRTLADGLTPIMKKSAYERVGVENDDEGRWICVDYNEVVVHLFDRDARSFYDMDHLWGDAPRVEFEPIDPAELSATSDSDAASDSDAGSDQ